MHIAFVVALLAAQDPVVAPVEVEPAPLEPAALVPVPPVEPAIIEAVPVAPCLEGSIDDDLTYRHTHAVLQAYAGQGRLERAATAVGAGALSAAMIGTAITYVAVGNVDIQLSKIDAEDTKLAGYVVGGAAILPAAVMVGALLMTSDEEARLAAFEVEATSNEDKRARVVEAEASLSQQASSVSWVPAVSGAALIAGGFASAGVGAYFLLLPHLPEPRGPVTHGTGAELIGAGVAALGIGIVMIATSGSTAPDQIELLD